MILLLQLNIICILHNFVINVSTTMIYITIVSTTTFYNTSVSTIIKNVSIETIWDVPQNIVLINNSYTLLRVTIKSLVQYKLWRSLFYLLNRFALYGNNTFSIINFSITIFGIITVSAIMCFMISVSTSMFYMTSVSTIL